MALAMKVGSIVSHSGGTGWGSGKVLQVSASSVMIQFSDGKNRKIASSHFNSLEPAPLASFLPPPEPVAEVKPARIPRAPRKKK